MRRVVETVTCDICGDDAADDHPDVAFAWQGVAYVIDLCDGCYVNVDGTVGRIIAGAESGQARELRLRRLRRLYNGMAS